MWANADLPIEARMPKQVLLEIEKLMVSPAWNYDRRAVWLDIDTGALCVCEEVVFEVECRNGTIETKFTGRW